MNGYYGYGYGYAQPYYPSVGAWPWGYVGQEPPASAAPALDPNFPVTSAFNRVFFGAYSRMPTPMELLDYALGWAIDGYGDAFAHAAKSAGSWPTDRAAQLRLVKQQISAHVRQMLSRSGL